MRILRKRLADMLYTPNYIFQTREIIATVIRLQSKIIIEHFTINARHVSDLCTFLIKIFFPYEHMNF